SRRCVTCRRTLGWRVRCKPRWSASIPVASGRTPAISGTTPASAPVSMPPRLLSAGSLNPSMPVAEIKHERLQNRLLSRLIRPADYALGLDFARVQVHPESGSVGHADYAGGRLQRCLQKELVDLIPLDQVFEPGAQGGRL